MWLMLQQDTPDDYVVASGETHTVREFAQRAFAAAGITLEWQGSGIGEKGINTANGKAVITVDPRFYRPAEVELLLGDPQKAEAELGWRRAVGFDELIRRMVAKDTALVQGVRQ